MPHKLNRIVECFSLSRPTDTGKYCRMFLKQKVKLQCKRTYLDMQLYALTVPFKYLFFSCPIVFYLKLNIGHMSLFYTTCVIKS